MRLEQVTVGLLREAIRLYERVAWGADGEHTPYELTPPDAEPFERIRDHFVDESQDERATSARRFVLRLGNARYPFMKLVLQEHLVQGEFFLEVDTHDQMFELEASEDERFGELKHYNLSVKERVESAWADADLPTASHLKGIVETAPAQSVPRNGRTILVVDDDTDIAFTLALLLEARGYEVSCLHDGRDAVSLADPELHDLILMDNEMKHLNGFEACRVLKSQERTADIPVLIATAGALTLQQLDAADGFLVKPFRAELLFSMLEHMLPDDSAL